MVDDKTQQDTCIKALTKCKAEFETLLEVNESRLHEIDKLISIFKHIHIKDPLSGDDICKQCGLDLRNPIHTRF